MKFIGQGNYMGILNFKGVCVDGVQYLWCPEEEKKHTPVNSSSDISGTSALSKSSLNIWKFTVHVLLKSGLENFERFFASICSVQFSCSVMSDSLRPHRRQPTRLRHPWDSQGKNTGVGCHFLFQCMKVKRESEVAQLCLTLRDPMDCSLPGSSARWVQFCGSLNISWHCLSLGLEWKLTFSSPMATAEFSMSGSNCCFLTSIHISQKAGKVVWYSHILRIFHSLWWSTT